MSENVINFIPSNASDDPDHVLKCAVGKFNNVLIIGYDKDDDLSVCADTKFSLGGIVWAIEMFKVKLLRGDYSEKEN